MAIVENTVLKQILANPKFAEFNPILIEEAYTVMVRVAPTLASILPVAGHFIRQVLVVGFITVDDIKALADTEIAVCTANVDASMRDMAQDAFFAGAVWGNANQPTDNGEMIHEGFEKWWNLSTPEETR